jgi:hypothetical protein
MEAFSSTSCKKVVIKRLFRALSFVFSYTQLDELRKYLRYDHGI